MSRPSSHHQSYGHRASVVPKLCSSHEACMSLPEDHLLSQDFNSNAVRAVSGLQDTSVVREEARDVRGRTSGGPFGFPWFEMTDLHMDCLFRTFIR